MARRVNAVFMMCSLSCLWWCYARILTSQPVRKMYRLPWGSALRPEGGLPAGVVVVRLSRLRHCSPFGVDASAKPIICIHHHHWRRCQLPQGSALRQQRLPAGVVATYPAIRGGASDAGAWMHRLRRFYARTAPLGASCLRALPYASRAGYPLALSAGANAWCSPFAAAPLQAWMHRQSRLYASTTTRCQGMVAGARSCSELLRACWFTPMALLAIFLRRCLVFAGGWHVLADASVYSSIGI